jgi:hypothetical protein
MHALSGGALCPDPGRNRLCVAPASSCGLLPRCVPRGGGSAGLVRAGQPPVLCALVGGPVWGGSAAARAANPSRLVAAARVSSSEAV